MSESERARLSESERARVQDTLQYFCLRGQSQQAGKFLSRAYTGYWIALRHYVRSLPVCMHIGVCLFMFHCVCLYCVDVSCRVWGGGVMKKDGGGGGPGELVAKQR